MSKQLLDEYFQSLDVSITPWPESSKPITFKTIEKFLDYIAKEIDFWRSLHTEISNKFQQIQDYINQSIQLANSNIDQAKQQLLQAINSAIQGQWPVVYSKTAIAQFIKKQFQANQYLGTAAIQYLIQKQVANISTYDYFKGYLNAYIFEETSKAFNEAAAAQESTLTDLRDDFVTQLNSLNDEHIQVTSDWKTEFHTKVSEWNKEADDFQTTLSNWRETIERKTEEKLNNTLSELEAIRKKYAELLRFDEPAKHWKNLEIDYETAGNKWKKWAVWTTVIFVSLLTLILFVHPDSQFIKNGVLDVNSLRNALIFTIITSVSIYLITLFVKLSISSYHLARDAKERYQLTHVYLSLLNENENAIKDTERLTVLQALFSRADTGLLKGDSGPSIPDGLSQIIKLLKR